MGSQRFKAFRIEDARKPAYLPLKNNKVIRADDVREFRYGIGYAADGRTHPISLDSVTGIDACAHASMIIKPKNKEETNSTPGGGPSFAIRQTRHKATFEVPPFENRNDVARNVSKSTELVRFTGKAAIDGHRHFPTTALRLSF